MDAFTLSLWVLRIAFVVLIYLFFFVLARALWRDLRTTVAGAGQALGRLVVVAAPEGRPAPGAAIPLDAVNSIGRDVNNAIVVDDSFASAEHALLSFRGRAWYVEDRGSTNGTWLNGQRVDSFMPMGYGDELQIGQVRFRLERTHPQ
ncbi:MAG TPA: FHA domain-containing protein [Candidatus Caenarcaniphilales bacterium]|nr:FHA domain-containing protein [Candidatus Caenarcaniphilales bacterium]